MGVKTGSPNKKEGHTPTLKLLFTKISFCFFYFNYTNVKVKCLLFLKKKFKEYKLGEELALLNNIAIAF